jgi:hypothetical protein
VLLFSPHRSIRSAAARSLEVRRFHLVSIAASVLLVVSAAACTNSPEAAVAGESPAANPASPAPAAGAGGDSASSLQFDPSLFGEDSATVDNEWFPLVPGTRYVWEGRAFEDDGERIERKVVFTVTDLTKVLGGVDTVVGWDRDYNDGELGESELIFFAQDKYGNVWHLGEYVEHYSEGEFEGARFWVVGDPERTEAGMHMPADPQVGDPSFSQGFAPRPWFWNDLARVYKTGVRTCVPVDCFDDALVMEEFEPRIKGAFQLKYYARGVGNIRVGWRGANEEEQEEMVLKKFFQLTPEALDATRADVLAHEHRAYAYGRTPPAERRTAEGP